MKNIFMINDPSDFNNELISCRAKRAHTSRSQDFVFMLDGEEAGFLSYENHNDKSIGFIYEIFVLPKFRRRGIGKSLLSYAENYAYQLQCNVVELKPCVLDQGMDLEQLESWYVNMGYAKKLDDPDKMEKHLIVI